MENTTPRSQKIRSSSQSLAPEDKNSVFWQEWQAYREHLYSCCLKWMNSNPSDAEEILSQAMLKAWNQWQNYGSKIKYPKAWLTRIIHNFCMDVHRKRRQEALEIGTIDDLKLEDYPALYSRLECPEYNTLNLELREYIDHKIKSLPPRLRDIFALYYYQNKSYKDIAKIFPFSEENVRKSVRKARRILQRHLTKYLAGEDDTSLDSSSSYLKLVTPLGQKPQPESYWEPLITTKSQDEEINYQVTVLCRESLSHYLYSSTNPLAWK